MSISLAERRKLILDELNSRGSVRVAELSEKMACSEVTIRTDIRELEKEGKLRRIHGGALLPPKDEAAPPEAEASPAPIFDGLLRAPSSLSRNVNEKMAIAAAAYQYIENDDTIIIDDASTTFYLAAHIRRHPEKRVIIVTNSLIAGNELSGLPHVELFMVGGTVGGKIPATIGEIAAENIMQFHVDKAFIGVHGINFDVGLTSVATPQMQIKKAILKVTDKVYVMADSSKFDGGYISVICPLNQVEKIITDDKINPAHIARAARAGVDLIIAPSQA